MASKKKDPYLPLEVVDIPLPTGDGPRHLFEATFLFTAPVGYSIDDIWKYASGWLLRGSKGAAEILVEYGGRIKNKTLLSPAGRAVMIKGRGGNGATCTEIIYETVPKTATKIKVLREVMPKKNEPKKKRKG